MINRPLLRRALIGVAEVESNDRGFCDTVTAGAVHQCREWCGLVTPQGAGVPASECLDDGIGHLAYRALISMARCWRSVTGCRPTLRVILERPSDGAAILLARAVAEWGDQFGVGTGPVLAAAEITARSDPSTDGNTPYL